MAEEVKFNEADEYLTRGAALYRNGKYEEALDSYKKAEQLDPKNINVYFKEGETYVMLGKYEEAKKTFKKIILVDKNNGLAYFHLGNTEFLLDNPDMGREMYAKAINAGYVDYQLYFNLGTYYEQEGEFEEAIKNYNKAIARDPFNPEAKLRKAELNINLGRNRQAIAALDELLVTNPDAFEGYHYKFLIFAQDEDWANASAVLDKALALFPDDQGFIFDKILLYERQEKFEEALAIIENCLKEGKNNEFIKEKAKILLAQGKKEESIALFESVRADKEYFDDDARYYLMNIYASDNQNEKALECAQELVSAGPDTVYYFNSLYMSAECMSRVKGEPDKAAYEELQEILRKVSTVYAERVDLFIYRALCYNKLGNYERAEEMANYVLALDENSGEAHAALSETYRLQGDTERAEQEEKMASSLSPMLNMLIKDEE